MCVWRVSLRRTKSAIISWAGSFRLHLLDPLLCSKKKRFNFWKITKMFWVSKFLGILLYYNGKQWDDYAILGYSLSSVLHSYFFQSENCNNSLLSLLKKTACVICLWKGSDNVCNFEAFLWLKPNSISLYHGCFHKYLSYDVSSDSVITSCIKNDNLLVD